MKTIHVFSLSVIFLLVVPALAVADSNRRDSQFNYQNHYYGSHQATSFRDYSRNYPRHQNSWDRLYPPRWGYSNYGNRYSQGNFGRFRKVSIQRGIASGQLSWDEVRELREDQREIAKKESYYRRDGRITNKERKELQEAYHDFRQDLHHELHDGERRW